MEEEKFFFFNIFSPVTSLWTGSQGPSTLAEYRV